MTQARQGKDPYRPLAASPPVSRSPVMDLWRAGADP